ncbi:MAG: hypothetical protein GX879_06545 [Bacteroidales bacterium]|nr:hypothetical protein [Bacteroidales bacterium]
MKKKIFKILSWGLLITYLFIILSFVSSKQQNTLCTKVNIKIKGKERFIDSTSISNLFINKGISLKNKPINSINFDEIEKTVLSQAEVAITEVYSEYNGELTIEVSQRKPILRIMPMDISLNPFYIDLQGETMPLSEKYTSHVSVLSGNISADFIKSNGNDSIVNNKVKKVYNYTLNDVYEFAKYLFYHELWSVQIEQIYIEKNYEIELIPRVGNHIIILGDLDNYKYKLYKLEAMYKEGFKLANWNNYSIINLKYSNQVVCKK